MAQTFEIRAVISGADAEYPQPNEQVLHHFTEVTVRFLDGFDWERDGKALLRRMRTAAEINEDGDKGEGK